jgi:SAM-dependent methyltransferase
MGVIGGLLGYELLKRISPTGHTGNCDARAYTDRSKLEALFGPQIWQEVHGKDVIDFGCGSGAEVVELATHGARRVTGIDIRTSALREAELLARQAGVADRCVFATSTDARADIIISLDSFEHFEDPEQILLTMRELIHNQGRILAVFGPTWYHPFGGHLFSVFPWAHLVFTEAALIRWRSRFKSDGARRFREVEGGLNQMTIRRFERLVARSPLAFDRFETVPIRRLDWAAHRWTREFTTSVVRCRLVPRRTV